MDVYEFAMNMEREGEIFYRELAKKTDNNDLKKIIMWLADEEVKHYDIFEAMKNNEKIEVSESNLLSDAKKTFEDMVNKELSFSFEISEVDVYKQALQHEAENIKFYLKSAEQIEDKKQKEALLQITEEEKKHAYLLENIIEFLLRPKNWLENAEFAQLGEY